MKMSIELNNVVSMTSLEIVELTGKRHDNVLRDCDNLLKVGGLKNEVSSEVYLSEQNKELLMYRLTKKAAFVLVSGYSAELRIKCFDYIELLESHVRLLEDALKRPAIQSAHRRGVTWGDYCKAHGLPAQKLMRILKEERRLFRVNSSSGEWSVKPCFAEYFTVIKPSNHRFNPQGINVRFNPKGCEFFGMPERVEKFRKKLVIHSEPNVDKQCLSQKQALGEVLPRLTVL